MNHILDWKLLILNLHNKYQIFNLNKSSLNRFIFFSFTAFFKVLKCLGKFPWLGTLTTFLLGTSESCFLQFLGARVMMVVVGLVLVVGGLAMLLTGGEGYRPSWVGVGTRSVKGVSPSLVITFIYLSFYLFKDNVRTLQNLLFTKIILCLTKRRTKWVSHFTCHRLTSLVLMTRSVWFWYCSNEWPVSFQFPFT